MTIETAPTGRHYPGDVSPPLGAFDQSLTDSCGLRRRQHRTGPSDMMADAGTCVPVEIEDALMISIRTIATAVVLCLASSICLAAELAEVRVSPPQIGLTTNRARQSVIVQAVYA